MTKRCQNSSWGSNTRYHCPRTIQIAPIGACLGALLLWIYKKPAARRLFRWRQFDPCDGQQVGRNNRGPDIRFKRRPSFPCATGKAHTALEPRYAGLDSGTKAAQAIVHLLATAHLGFFKATFFGKAYILDLATLGQLQIVFGSKTTSKHTLSG